MNVLAKQAAAYFLSLTSLILVGFSVSDTQVHAEPPSKCGCRQALTAAVDSIELSYYHSDFSLSTADPETQSNWLRLETLTEGRWVELDLSQPMINTTSQPLRISYVHTKPKQQKLEVSLVLREFITNATLASDAPNKSTPHTAQFKPGPDAVPRSSYRLKNLNSVVIPRLTPGVYSLELNEFKRKKEEWKSKPMAPKWLQVLSTPPEPPQLVSINQRLAERGKLTLKLKNVVVGDHIRFYVDGEQGPGVTISKESQLKQYFPLGSVLPPGKSKVTAQLKRGDQLSSDSSPVSVNSRATVFMTRQIEIKGNPFEEVSNEEFQLQREQSDTEFHFVGQNHFKQSAEPTMLADEKSKESGLIQTSDMKLSMVSLSQTQAQKPEIDDEGKKEENCTSASKNAADNQKDKKIPIREFAFPYPASFPVPRYGQRGNEFETEGVVLDQMRLAIAEDGTYRVDFLARTTMRADINLQLLVKLKDNHWYPITLPRQTILPENYQNFTTGSANSPQIQPVSIQGYAPVFVSKSSKITDIRRRGNAVFGTRPPITTQYHKTNCCDQKPDCSPAASTSTQESSCTKQPESK